MDEKMIRIPGWKIIRTIGKGSFGCVYEVEKEGSFGSVAHSALKVISIPETDAEVKAFRDDGYDDASLTKLFKSRVGEITAEFELMSKLKGDSHIVSYEDHSIVQHENDPGYDIYIRMELLTALPDHINRQFPNGVLPDAAVAKLGADVCRALECCERYNIVHRDIKPQNIFVNERGDYKLGDFGIAKTSDHTTKATKTGTYSYMAPEVYLSRPYNASVDIYSLGLVLYWMLNERRGPFLPLPPEVPTSREAEEGLYRRMRGEPIPAPKNGDETLKRIVLKACAFDPRDRYKSPAEMRQELEQFGSAGRAAIEKGAAYGHRAGENRVMNRMGENVGAAIADTAANEQGRTSSNTIAAAAFHAGREYPLKTIFCPFCGKPQTPGHEFCAFCGKPMDPRKALLMRQKSEAGAKKGTGNADVSQRSYDQRQTIKRREPEPPKKKSKLGILIGAVAGGAVLIAAVVVLLILQPWNTDRETQREAGAPVQVSVAPMTDDNPATEEPAYEAEPSAPAEPAYEAEPSAPAEPAVVSESVPSPGTEDVGENNSETPHAQPENTDETAEKPMSDPTSGKTESVSTPTPNGEATVLKLPAEYTAAEIGTIPEKNGLEKLSEDVLVSRNASQYDMLNYMGEKVEGGPFVSIKSIKDGYYTVTTDHDDVNTTGLVNLEGEVLIPCEAAIIRRIDNDSTGQDSQRYLLVVYGTGEVQSQSEMFFYTTDSFSSFGGPKVGDKMYAGYAKVYDLKTRRFVDGIKITNPGYTIQHLDDYLAGKNFDKSAADGKTYVYDQNGNQTKVFQETANIKCGANYLIASNNKYYLYSGNGDILYETYNSLRPIWGSGRYVYEYIYNNNADANYRVLDCNGNECFTRTGRYISFTEYNGVFCLEEDGEYTLLDVKGNELFRVNNRLKYDGYGCWSYSYTENKETVYCLVLPDGRVIESADWFDRFVSTVKFGDGITESIQYKMLVLNDPDDPLVIESTRVSILTDGLVSAEVNNKRGVYDLFSGKQLIKPEYSRIYYAGGYLYAFKDGAWTIFELTLS